MMDAALAAKVRGIVADLRTLARSEVLVGIPGKTASRDDPGAMNNPTLGYIHEFGSPAAGIPRRPFLTPGVEAIRARTVAEFRGAALAALKGDANAAERTLNRVGLIAQNSVRATLTAGEGWPPLAEATLAAREARGRTGTRPLIDTGQLRASITYVVERRGKY
jgi:hypothetical protein